MKQVCKLMIVDTFKYGELKRLLDAIEALGYSLSFVNNGNVLVEEGENSIVGSVAVSRTVDVGSTPASPNQTKKVVGEPVSFPSRESEERRNKK